MDKRKICRHRFLAGFLGFLMFWTLFVAGILFSVKGGIFKSTSIKGFIDDNEINELLYVTCDELIENEMNDSELSWLLEAENYEDIKNELVDIMVEALLEKQESINFDKVVDLVMESLEEESEVIIDEVFNEIETEAENFDARSNETIQNIIDTYAIEIDDSFYDELNSYIDKADELEQYRDDVKAELDAQVIEPAKENKDEISAELTASFEETLDEYYASEGFSSIEQVDGIFGIASNMLLLVAGGFLAVSILFMIFILILYRRGIFGAFSKLAVITGINGALFALVGSAKNTVASVIDSYAASEIDKIKDKMGTDISIYIEKIMDIIFGPFLKVGIAFLIVMAVAIVIWAISKISYKNRTGSTQ